MNGEEIAIVGMSGKFPGAKNIEQLWANLKQGKESISFLSDEELKKVEINKNHVPCKGGELQEKDYFDAAFFGYSPKEAELMDPQIRIFHECVWEALEDAGYCSGNDNKRIGLYAGASDNFPWKFNAIRANKNRSNLAIGQLIDKDFLCSRISYNLNLKGPSYIVQTACSTSLVAVHLACQGILNGDTDIAIAGGISIGYGMGKGYYYQEGSILSADGHCRPFDHKANGTVPSSGVGVVVLKFLETAIRDNDNIYAVIKGTAINNDGNVKIGYTAPGVFGQSNVIKQALNISEVDSETISYIEAHGTGTELGDPAEIEALSLAFNSDKKNYCAIGSIKGNLGHLDAAAGITGLIKSALSLKNKLLVPSINYERPNPKINFASSPFYVVDELKKWERNGNYPLRAGISAFGIGGTNAHAILEEYREPLREDVIQEQNIFLLSAKNEKALELMRQQYLSFLKKGELFKVEDICYSLSIGRKAFNKRLAFSINSKEELVQKLEGVNINEIDQNSGNKAKRIVFMFPGQGSQSINMGLGLYRKERKFQEIIDNCFSSFYKIKGYDLKAIVFPERECKEEEKNKINSTEIVQPLLFIFEYSLFKFLKILGLNPNIMIGHSIGEYVAACISNVFSFEEGLKIVCKRGELMGKMPRGAMLSTNINEKDFNKYIESGISIAAINTQNNIVVSGEIDKINKLQSKLQNDNIASSLLRTSHAFHSEMMKPIVSEFEEFLNQFELKKPEIDFISNITGGSITDDMATSSQYWANHIISTVKFSEGIENLATPNENIFIEVGSGNTLASLVKKNRNVDKSHKIVNLLGNINIKTDDQPYIYSKLVDIWMNGIDINFYKLYGEEKRKRVSLPTYPFEKKSYWPKDFKTNLSEAIRPIAEHKEQSKDGLYYMPYWEQLVDSQTNNSSEKFNWLIFINDFSLCEKINTSLQNDGHNLIYVKVGNEFKKLDKTTYSINISDKGDYNALVNSLEEDDQLPDKILHCWTIENDSSELDIVRYQKYQQLGFYSIIFLLQAYGKKGISKKTEIKIVTNNLFEVFGGELLYPEKSALTAISKLLPLEYDNFNCKCIDFKIDECLNEYLIKNILKEISIQSDENIVSLRGQKKWIQKYKPVELSQADKNKSKIRKRGIYLITGGTGGMGSSIAKYLANEFDATVIALSRKGIDTFTNNDIDDKELISRKNLIEDTKKSNGKIIVKKADVTNYSEVLKIVEETEQNFGSINGVLHAAATIDGFGVIQRRSKDDFEESMDAKIVGLLGLNKIFKDRNIDFILNFSTLGSILYDSKYGELGYVAANEFLDAFTHFENGLSNTKKISVNWCDWKQVGMAERSINKITNIKEDLRDKLISEYEKAALSPEEGMEVFAQIVNSDHARLALCKTDLIADIGQIQERLKIKKMLYTSKGSKDKGNDQGNDPKNNKEFVLDSNLEKELLQIWKEYLGYEEIGFSDNIFELGANSLDVAQINGIIKSKLNIDIPVVTYFEYPTILSFVDFLKNRNSQDNNENERNEKLVKGIEKLGRIKQIKKSKAQ